MLYRRSMLQVMASIFGSIGLNTRQKTASDISRSGVVGTWHLQTMGAPILHHLLLFFSDGIVCSYQADGGFPNDSESDGAGEWKWVGDNQVKGAFLEFRHDRESHMYLGYVRVAFTITLDGNTFKGNATSYIYDAQGNLLASFTPTWSATRVGII